jgi:hypothetical protein
MFVSFLRHHLEVLHSIWRPYRIAGTTAVKGLVLLGSCTTPCERKQLAGSPAVVGRPGLSLLFHSRLDPSKHAIQLTVLPEGCNSTASGPVVVTVGVFAVGVFAAAD